MRRTVLCTHSLLAVRRALRIGIVLDLDRLLAEFGLFRASVGTDRLGLRIISSRITDIKLFGGIKGIIVRSSRSRVLGIMGIRKSRVQGRVRVRWL